MRNPHRFIQICAVFVLVCAVVALGYPAAFIITHGWNSAAWPANLPLTPIAWLQALPNYPFNLALVASTYWEMLHGVSPAFAGGGFLEVAVLGCGTIFFGTMIAMGGKLVVLRDPSNIFGSTQWASLADRERMNSGLEIGLDPETNRPIRIQVEGNLLTIAPPRTGKTGGFIIPNLVFPEPGAWAGPAVVIDPKGDAYRAVKRRREAMGKTVRCIDPLDFAGGKDRWNPLSRTDATDVLYLQSMALALLPPAEQGNEAGAYFRSRAVDVIVAAIIATISNGRPDPVGAAQLLMDQPAFLAALANRTDQASVAARNILNMEERARENIVSTAEQATQWLRDARMQTIVQDHTFEMSDLASGDVDLFIVLPADDRKEILAPYVRWLLADLFTSVRENRPAERIIAFIDEAVVLGKFDAVLKGAGELPGYGISLWTFWQTRDQIFETYGKDGAKTFMGLSEITNVFNISAVQTDEKKHWSEAIGSYTGVSKTKVPDTRTGRINETHSPVEVRLVAATDVPNFLHEWQVAFLTSTVHTPDPIKLRRTLAYTDPRFQGLIDLVAPVGRSA